MTFKVSQFYVSFDFWRSKERSRRTCAFAVCVCVFMTKTPALSLEVIISSRLHSTPAPLHPPPSPYDVIGGFFLHDGPTFSVCSGIQGFFQSNVSFILLSETLHIRFTRFMPACW